MTRASKIFSSAKMAAFVLIFLWSFVFPFPALSAQSMEPSRNLGDPDLVYLYSVYQDTWNYLAAFTDEKTGLPYDSSARQPPTSLTNIGLYLASVAVAYRTSLISRDEAEARITHCLDSLEKIETWRGIPRPWVAVKTLQPTFGNSFHYGPHLSALVGGLLVAQSSFPEVAFAGVSPRIHDLLTRMEFKSLYEPKNGWLKGGYDVRTKDFSIYQPWGHWYYKFFASETRLLSFYLIARGLVPENHWFKLIRPTEEREGENYFVAGYEDGGLYVQAFTGLFLDERDSEIGDSLRAMIRLQRKHAGTIQSPVWGWTSCLTSQGNYLGYGELRDDIVAPYASMLAAIYEPREAVANLRRLEELGARPSETVRLGDVRYGFLDSINWKTGDVAPHYLTPNQAMGFLSLANVLYSGIVWQSFREAPVVDKKIEHLERALEIKPFSYVSPNG